jgi:hypothetical protein
VTISKNDAKSLCTQREWELISASWAPEVNRLDAGELRNKVSLTRGLRDKFRDLAKQQAGEARGKRGPRSTRPSQSNENTRRKAQIFNEALSRFQDRLDRAE